MWKLAVNARGAAVGVGGRRARAAGGVGRSRERQPQQKEDTIVLVIVLYATGQSHLTGQWACASKEIGWVEMSVGEEVDWPWGIPANKFSRCLFGYSVPAVR